MWLMSCRLSVFLLLLGALIPLTGLPDVKEGQRSPLAIIYQLKQPGQVSAAVYDSTGRQVRTLLTGQKQEAGRHTLQWDGLDRSGHPMPSGSYEWRVLRTPGFTREFMVNVGTNSTWSPWDWWPGNHAGPTTVMIDREESLYVGSISSEGPPDMLKLSLDGRRKFWDAGAGGQRDGLMQIARIDDALYLLDYDARLWIRRADTGREFYGHPQRRKFADKHLPFADLLHAGDSRPTQPKSGNRKIPPMCLAAGRDYLVVTYRDHDEVRFLWPSVDRIAKTRQVHVSAPQGVTVAPDGRVFVVSERTIVQVDPESGLVKELVRDLQQQYPTRVAFDPAFKDLLVAQRGPEVNHVRRYSAADGHLVAVYGRLAGRTYGLFNPLDWDTIQDIAADGRGGFVTVEDFPRRVAHFQGRERHQLVRQWFGGMEWEALCTLDPADPTIVYVFPDHKHCGRGKIDYGNRNWTLTHLYDLPENFSWHLGRDFHRAMFPAFGEQSFWTARHVGENTFLVNNGVGYGAEGISVIRVDEQDQKLVPVARLGVLHPSVDKAKPPGWWLAAMSRAGFDRRRSGVSNFCYSWSDSNHNGKIDLGEVVLAHQNFGYTASQFYVDQHWNVYRVGQPVKGALPSLALMIPNRGRDPQYPVWNWDDARPLRGRLLSDDLGGLRPESRGIFRDSQGSVFEVFNGLSDQNASDNPPTNWPNNRSGASRFVKWNGSGAREWAVGVHVDDEHLPPGGFADVRAVLGEVRGCLVMLDARSPATVWTRDGLYAGSFLDRRANDGLPDAIYEKPPTMRLIRNDHGWGQVLETPAGDVIWGALSFQSTPFFRIRGWDGWERHGGTLVLDEPMPAARWQGTGLRGEYFSNIDLRGEPVLTRTDPNLWFGPLSGDHRQFKARNPWFIMRESQPLDPGSCSARWTGFVEAPLTDEYYFIAYTYGRADQNKKSGSKVRLWIDGKQAIDEWSQVGLKKAESSIRTRGCQSVPIALRAGQRVPIRLDYAASGGNEAHLHLYWRSGALDQRHVPQSLLYPD
jgi:hypothetical protein